MRARQRYGSRGSVLLAYRTCWIDCARKKNAAAGLPSDPWQSGERTPRRARSERQIVRAGFAFGGRRAAARRNGHLHGWGGFVLAPVLGWSRRPTFKQQLAGPERDRLTPVVLLVGPFPPVEFGVH